jgi:hypothetical protein
VLLAYVRLLPSLCVHCCVLTVCACFNPTTAQDLSLGPLDCEVSQEYKLRPLCVHYCVLTVCACFNPTTAQDLSLGPLDCEIPDEYKLRRYTWQDVDELVPEPVVSSPQ